MKIELNNEEWALVILGLTKARRSIEADHKAFCDGGDAFEAQAAEKRLATIDALKDRLYA